MKHNLEIWLPAYLRQVLWNFSHSIKKPLHLVVAVADHFEPFWGKADRNTALTRLSIWENRLAKSGEGCRDSRGKGPQHTFFYPLDEYDPWVMDRLAALREQGLGDVEVHLHHHGETSAQLEEFLLSWIERLHQKHGLLRKDPQTGNLAYGFIHGNWALDNSRPDGMWCGVNDEISILARTGCYADFTLPSAPSPTQTRIINSIYYATDDPERPKSHDQGRPVKVGVPPSGDLLMVQGVLALNFRRRKYGVLPSLENSDLGAHRPPGKDRVPAWIKYAPRVIGAENIRFLKLHCHGAPEVHHEALLGEAMQAQWQAMTGRQAKENGINLYFVTCWEMVQLIKRIEKGEVAF
ncbi:hypothetical protein [Dethiosulfatarculus sandiegensis]|uniref:Uncharacterized protein n=1 Tax=Dethiosulfatarculus sandiegensis TaxID=1429043 RepID=A0A0D2JUL0_9BACT|nr:hypothetical protein [Dethiosulfatarculus sandiegensis]KIX13205.1 hypothetical protein X474_14930 [Dethiosulfatarculus sandiegensis]